MSAEGLELAMLLARSAPLLVAQVICLFLAACGDDEKKTNQVPHVRNVQVYGVEDNPLTSQLVGVDPEGGTVRFSLETSPAQGNVIVDEATGWFTYTPDRDYFGSDSFFYTVTDGQSTSPTARVSIDIINVNDVPVLKPIDDLSNSAYVRDVTVPLVITDVDGDVFQPLAVSADESVATVRTDAVSGAVLVTAHNYGATRIEVTVRDNAHSVKQSFNFSVRDVTRVEHLATDETQAILFENTDDNNVRLTFNHNGFPLFNSDAHMADHVHAMPEAFPAEPFQRKLWRFVRDSAYHAVQLSNDNWPLDPWMTINSFGWGLCSQVASTYVRVARAAGFNARMWGIGPHVVPEVEIDGRWEMFDPDLAIYYFNRDGEVAGVQELAADPTLITAPVQPIFAADVNPFAYSDFIAEAYSDTSDNVIASERAFHFTPNFQPLVLPSGATFAYPVNIDATVDGTHDGEPNAIPHFLQAAVTLPIGWTGELRMPWVIWGIDGAGTVAIDDIEYAIGSDALRDRIRNAALPIVSTRIVASASPVRLTYFVNALHYELQDTNSVEIAGKDIWAIGVHTVTVDPAMRVPRDRDNPYRKVKPTLP